MAQSINRKVMVADLVKKVRLFLEPEGPLPFCKSHFYRIPSCLLTYTALADVTTKDPSK
jgi:hypothetical protein